MNYITFGKVGYGRYEEKHSVFLGMAMPVSTEEEAIAAIKDVRSEYPDARHTVYAYRLREGARVRYSDDREPSGTAGVPILDILTKSEYENCLVTVTRYFGGILLGTGGLVRAYTETAQRAILDAGTVQKQLLSLFSFSCEYGDYGKFEKLLTDNGVKIDSVDFTDKVTLSYAVANPSVERIHALLREASAGRIVHKTLGEVYRNVEIEPIMKKI